MLPNTRNADGSAARAALAAPPRTPRRTTITPVLLVGVVIEVALAVGLVRPAWLFGHHAAIPTPEPLAAVLGLRWSGLVRVAVTFALWLAGYAAAMVLARRPLTVGARRALVFLPVLFAGTLLFMLPVSSKDVYHYLMEGRALAVYGDNPMNVPPAAYPEDPLAWTVSSWGDTPSRYGPAFNLLAAAVAAVAGDNLVANLLGFKLLMVAALFGTAALAGRTAGRLRPEAAPAAYVFVAWNPLALYEAAANAHNDLLMVFATALALELGARRRWALALPALALGALTKYVVALLGPLVLIESLAAACSRTAPRPLRPPRSFWLGLVFAVALAVVLYAPFWNGRHTFDAVTSASGDMLSSPGWLLRQVLKHRFGWEGAKLPVVLLMSAAFLVGYGSLLWWHGRMARAGVAPAERLAAFALAVLALELCTLSWWLWPWYTLWLLPPAALLVGRWPAGVVAVANGVALLAYIPLNFRELFWGPPTTDRMPLAVVLLLFLPTLLAALLLWRRGCRAPVR
jgi:alpha-1,6-mannosyltransferase